MNSDKDKTIRYYEEHAEEFALSVSSVSEVPAFSRFLKLVQKHCDWPPRVLELGCGTGRDAKMMLENGFNVDATDASVEMVRIASSNMGQPARLMSFDCLEANDEYDAVWANACLLHLDRGELASVLPKISHALKTGGILYASFKEGNFEGVLSDRYFRFWKEGELRQVFSSAVPDLNILDVFTTDDAREQNDNIWLNVLALKGGS